MGRVLREGKALRWKKLFTPENKIKQNSTSVRTQDAGLTRTSTLRSMPELQKHSALQFWLARAAFNCPLATPSCFVQVEKAKLPFNSRMGAYTRHQGSSGSREEPLC